MRIPRLSKGQKILFGCLFVLLSVVSIVLMAYPAISAIYAESVRSEIHTQYEEIINQADTSELDAARESAIAYNERLFTGKISPLTPEENGYFKELILSDSEVMCYISIPKIDVYLPVYHGIGSAALSAGAGHMPQSSLPVGGENTHAVISAHTGMANSPMFSDLELLRPGDIFQVIVLGETLTYQVQSDADILIVLPQEIEAIQIRRDEDVLTLVTCTPYGVNTHRLLVTGHRIETPTQEAPEQEETTPTALQEDAESVYRLEYQKSIVVGAVVGVGIVTLGLIALLVVRVLRKNNEENEEDEQDEE